MGPGQSPGGGPDGEAPGSSWILEILLTLKHFLIAENLQYFIFTSDHHMLKKICTKVGRHLPPLVLRP
jgi:hypothetical protein